MSHLMVILGCVSGKVDMHGAAHVRSSSLLRERCFAPLTEHSRAALQHRTHAHAREVQVAARVSRRWYLPECCCNYLTGPEA